MLVPFLHLSLLLVRLDTFYLQLTQFVDVLVFNQITQHLLTLTQTTHVAT